MGYRHLSRATRVTVRARKSGTRRNWSAMVGWGRRWTSVTGPLRPFAPLRIDEFLVDRAEANDLDTHEHVGNRAFCVLAIWSTHLDI